MIKVVHPANGGKLKQKKLEQKNQIIPAGERKNSQMNKAYMSLLPSEYWFMACLTVLMGDRAFDPLIPCPVCFIVSNLWHHFFSSSLFSLQSLFFFLSVTRPPCWMLRRRRLPHVTRQALAASAWAGCFIQRGRPREEQRNAVKKNRKLLCVV